MRSMDSLSIRSSERTFPTDVLISGTLYSASSGAYEKWVPP